VKLARESGFTLLELIVAMSVFTLIGIGLYGVLVLGAKTAGSGERITEQARRYRIANEVLARQIAAAAPIQLPKPKDQGDDELGEDDDDSAQTSEPFFFGRSDTVEFVTNAPQRPDASGLAIVSYWMEDGELKMSEKPAFTAFAGGKKKLDRKNDEMPGLTTTLLYDVASVTFAYQRESDSDEWLDTWDATDEDKLPACVRIDVKPSAVDGPDFYHEIPVMVGTFNQITDADSDFHVRRAGRKQAAGEPNPKPKPNPTSEPASPPSTADPDPAGD
jgi:prepilin-type N-terminal cleavage/methylation domain-containing protein